MTLTELYKQSEYYTDETMSATFALSYANKALAYINTELNLLLPFFPDALTAYTALSDSWLMRLILPYLNYGIKMNDASMNEAVRYEEEFFAALSSFRESFSTSIDAEYISENASNIYQSSARNVNPGWFNTGW